jgi:hypothetical protein
MPPKRPLPVSNSNSSIANTSQSAAKKSKLVKKPKLEMPDESVFRQSPTFTTQTEDGTELKHKVEHWVTSGDGTSEKSEVGTHGGLARVANDHPLPLRGLNVRKRGCNSPYTNGWIKRDQNVVPNWVIARCIAERFYPLKIQMYGTEERDPCENCAKGHGHHESA